jgi:hypothetical protein
MSLGVKETSLGCTCFLPRTPTHVDPRHALASRCPHDAATSGQVPVGHEQRQLESRPAHAYGPFGSLLSSQSPYGHGDLLGSGEPRAQGRGIGLIDCILEVVVRGIA